MFILFFAAFFAAKPVVASAASLNTSPGTEASTGTQEWSAKMRELYPLLAKLLTQTSNPNLLHSSTADHSLQENTKKLAEISKSLLHATKPESDPSLPMLVGLFSDQAERAYKEVKRGHHEYALELLRSMPGYCIACHTRTQNGPRFSSLPLSPTRPLPHYEMGKFYAATRQFDRAMQEFLATMDEKNSVIQRPLQWEGAVRYALAVAVRVNHSPDQALSIVDRVLNTEYAPYFIRQNAEGWKKSLLAWRAEAPRKLNTAEGFLSEAQRLILEARSMQKYPADRSADILYLRGSSAVHELMAMKPGPALESQAFLLAATSYEALRDLGIEDFHEMYYEACIRTSPHTPISDQCFERLQQSLFADYSGSSGLNLPDDVKIKLGILEGLARESTHSPQ